MIAKSDKISELIVGCRKSFFYVGLFSLLINLLMLTVPLFMLQIFDRVLASQSYDTLVYLTIIAIVALMVFGILDSVRGRILVEVSRWIDNKLSPLSLSNSFDNVLDGQTYGYECLKDIGNVKFF